MRTAVWTPGYGTDNNKGKKDGGERTTQVINNNDTACGMIRKLFVFARIQTNSKAIEKGSRNRKDFFPKTPLSIIRTLQSKAPDIRG
jgi:hypothetical protein